jgi:hypothetical protein
MSPTAGKAMASTFCDSEGIIFINYLPKEQTITGQYYTNLISKLCDAVKEKRRAKHWATCFFTITLLPMTVESRAESNPRCWI